MSFTVRGLAVVALLVATLSTAAAAATFKTLYTFTGNPDGDGPTGLTFFKNAFYGTTTSGGGANAGTVFRIDGRTYQKTTLYKFCTVLVLGQCEGQWPRSPVIADNKTGALYGVTPAGGNYDSGILFKVSPPVGGGSWTFTTLYTFCLAGGDCAHDPNGAGPSARLVLASQGILDSQGILYGTTSDGGTGNCNNFHGCGTVFKFELATGTLTTLYTFTGGADGHTPGALVLSKDKRTLYGTTGGGSDSCGYTGCGTVFKIDIKTVNGAPTYTFATLHSFTAGAPEGQHPGDLVLDGSGMLYSATDIGGDAGYGAIFRLNPATQAVDTLYQFSGQLDGWHPQTPLVFDRTGTQLYGATKAGGSANDGTVFRLDLSSGVKQTIYTFAGSEGYWPGSVVLHANAIYGVAAGPPGQPGQVFKIVP